MKCNRQTPNKNERDTQKYVLDQILVNEYERKFTTNLTNRLHLRFNTFMRLFLRSLFDSVSLSFNFSHSVLRDVDSSESILSITSIDLDFSLDNLSFDFRKLKTKQEKTLRNNAEKGIRDT